MGDAVLEAHEYDGCVGDALATLLGLPSVELFALLPSTQDVAHAMAGTGAPAGTLILADAQSAGRGRRGRAWTSESGRGIWLTLIERPSDPRSLDVLSIRIGLALAAELDDLADTPIRLKWPNDLYAGEGKLGGILLEARWRNAELDWIAIGFGLNVRPPIGQPAAAALRDGVARVEALRRIVPGIRRAARLTGQLTPAEVEAFDRRDLARGRRSAGPLAGVVAGIDSSGALLIDGPGGRACMRFGSLQLEGEL